VIATGKEAVVFSGTMPSDAAACARVLPRNKPQRPTGEMQPCAVKIFKTTVSEFKNRAEYTSSSHYFGEASQANLRSVIKLWARKEFTNLKHIFEAGIACPEPIVVRNHVLLMRLIGDDGNPAPQLRHVRFPSAASAAAAYLQCVQLLRALYQDAGLVHGDLSEFNLLYWKKTVYVIDVSQAVACDSQNALGFLRRDISNISAFFKKAGLGEHGVMTLEQLFAFVTSPAIDEDAYLESVQAILKRRQDGDDDSAVDAGVEMEPSTFVRLHIPVTLAAIADPFAATTDDSLPFSELITGLKAVRLLPSACGGEHAASASAAAAAGSASDDSDDDEQD